MKLSRTADKLLKPAGDDEILNAVLAAAEEIRRELAEKHNLAELQRKWRVRLPRLQADFCRNWMSDRYAEWELHKHMRELNMELEGYSHFAVTVCKIDPLLAEESRFTAADLPLLQFSLECIAGEFADGQDCRVFADADGATALLFFERGEGAEQALAKRVNLQVPRLLHLSSVFTRIIQSRGWSMPKVLQDAYRRFLSFESLLSKDQIVEWAKRAAGYIASYRENERRSSTHRLVKQMMEAVEQMLSEEDLSLHTLAERLYVNPSYLSRLFKRETGTAFSGYVLKRPCRSALSGIRGWTSMPINRGMPWRTSRKPTGWL
ncbi:hypothetical protein [Paenibacillus macerans]|uniref:hypothetical protein n=1 Tax=Paenibacillus macerans TaxID=44252 RepID=UPI003D31E3C5